MTTVISLHDDVNNNNNDANKWSNLLPDLLRLIAFKFDNYKDLLAFRSVCNSWRSIAMTDERLTLLPPLFIKPYNTSTETRTFFDPSSHREITFRLPETVGKFIYATAHGYLLLSSSEHQGNGDDKLLFTLFNPITRSQIHLPPIRCPCLLKEWSTCRRYRFRDFRVSLSSHPCSDPAPVLAIWNNYKLSLLTLGDAEWKEVELGKNYFSEDGVFAYCNDYFFMLSKGSRFVLVVDAQSLESTEIDVPDEDMDGVDVSYRMIVFSGYLFLVVNNYEYWVNWEEYKAHVTFKLVKKNGGGWQWSKEDYNKSNKNECVTSGSTFFLSDNLSITIASPWVIFCWPNYIYNALPLYMDTKRAHEYYKLPVIRYTEFGLPFKNPSDIGYTEFRLPFRRKLGRLPLRGKPDRYLYYKLTMHKYGERPLVGSGYTWFIPSPR